MVLDLPLIKYSSYKKIVKIQRERESYLLLGLSSSRRKIGGRNREFCFLLGKVT